MFPNPQDALPLPPRPNLERYRKLAKELVKAARSSDATAIHHWAAQWMRSLTRVTQSTPEIDRRTNHVEGFARRQLSDRESTGGKGALTRAQFVIARLHGFESWPKFVKHLEEFQRENSPVFRFEMAADAIVAGELPTLRRLLQEDPTLVHATSTREHGASLLHYVAANGVEDFRQETPPNIVEIAEALLAAGAEVDAAAHVYGGGCTALGLAATGIHPERAGVQNALLDKLLEHGAVLEQPSIGGNRLPLLMACLSNGRLKAAEHLAGRGARLNLPVAAALGRLDLTRSFFQAGGGTPGPTAEEMTVGFLFACAGGRNRVIEFLLERGVPLTAQDSSGQTGLHWAAIGGHLDTVKLLLHRGAPLEVMNSYGGTVLGQALWSVANDGEKPDSIGILEALVDAGASLPNPCPPVNPRVDAWLSQHGRIT